jgi:hypothetical protein
LFCFVFFSPFAVLVVLDDFTIFRPLLSELSTWFDSKPSLASECVYTLLVVLANSADRCLDQAGSMVSSTFLLVVFVIFIIFIIFVHFAPILPIIPTGSCCLDPQGAAFPNEHPTSSAMCTYSLTAKISIAEFCVRL